MVAVQLFSELQIYTKRKQTQMINITFILLVLSFSHQARGWRKDDLFQHFFPDVRVEFSKAITNNCSNVLQEYLDQRVVFWGVHCVKTYSCIMTNTTQYTQNNMASAAVLLGLTPVILATLGSSTPELSLLASRRPALAILLVLGSPAMNPIRKFNYKDPTVELREKKWRWDLQKRSQIGDIICVILELFFAFGSIVNLVTLCRTIASNTISVMSCDFSDTLFGLWIGLALIAHLSGRVTFSMRGKMENQSSTRPRFTYLRIREWLRNEFSPCVRHTEHELIWEEENKWFIVSSFFTAVYTMIHLTAGILIFSSTSFVGIPDAAMIAGRFMASMLICRIIAAYELAGMTAAIGTGVEDQPNANSGDIEMGNYAARGETEDQALGRNIGTGSGISPAQSMHEIEVANDTTREETEDQTLGRNILDRGGENSPAQSMNDWVLVRSRSC